MRPCSPGETTVPLRMCRHSCRQWAATIESRQVVSGQTVHLTPGWTQTLRDLAGPAEGSPGGDADAPQCGIEGSGERVDVVNPCGVAGALDDRDVNRRVIASKSLPVAGAGIDVVVVALDDADGDRMSTQ